MSSQYGRDGGGGGLEDVGDELGRLQLLDAEREVERAAVEEPPRDFGARDPLLAELLGQVLRESVALQRGPRSSCFTNKLKTAAKDGRMVTGRGACLCGLAQLRVEQPDGERPLCGVLREKHPFMLTNSRRAKNSGRAGAGRPPSSSSPARSRRCGSP